jgi:outer membrane protein TolC
LNISRALAWITVLISLVACSVGPNYHRPSAPVPAEYKEFKGWKVAAPNDTINRGAWWSIYRDPTLDGLERRVNVSNQTLKQDEAAYREARALVREQQESALIGVQVAAYYPTVDLAAGFGYAGGPAASLFSASNQVWSLMASATETLLSGGQRSAAVAAARAVYDQSVANYRETILAAFQNVEDELASLRILGQQIGVNQAAVQAAQQAVDITLNEYQAGTVAYTTVITAQVTLLTDQETALLVQEDRLIASVALVQALGGGWETSQLPTQHELQKLHLIPD